MKFATLAQAIDYMHDYILLTGKPVKTETWQGLSTEGRPEMEMIECRNVFLSCPIPSDNLKDLANIIQPNVPWADHHLNERLSGEPLNPPPSWRSWPWGHSAEKFLEGGQFNHTYPERMWPKYAGKTSDGRLGDLSPNEPANRGIRHEYGDLDDVIRLLEEQPLTRQAFLPIWFPEDTGVVHRDRVPCTIGYHFMMRDDKLHLFYPIRSCDYTRHFRDDIYLALGLLVHVLRRLRLRSDRWLNVKPGDFSMHMQSLHVFRNDFDAMKRGHRVRSTEVATA